jgi:hypothetical protein
MVAPMGTIKLLIDGDTPNFSLAVLMDKGITAAELVVENASNCTSTMFLTRSALLNDVNF